MGANDIQISILIDIHQNTVGHVVAADVVRLRVGVRAITVV